MVKHLYFSNTTNSLTEDDGSGGGSNDNDGGKRVLLQLHSFNRFHIFIAPIRASAQ